VTKLSYNYSRQTCHEKMIDITKDEVQNKGKEKALTIIKGALELAGLNPEEYDLSLYRKTRVRVAPNIQLFQTAAYLAATCLSPSANKILMYFLSLTEFENYVGIDQKTLHEDLNISLRSTERGINELVDNGIIIKVKHLSDKRRNDYFINPMSAWKGKIKNRKRALSILNKELDSQLNLFGEAYMENQLRENQEIQDKRPSLMTLKKKDIEKLQQRRPSD
jgi:DNA-binding MarR family transcriptional regulator